MTSEILPPPSPDTRSRSGAKPAMAACLSVALLVFLAASVVSLANESLILFFNSHALSGVDALFGIPALLVALAVYGLMALSPMVPKRIFLPVTLFAPVAGLMALPLLVYFHEHVVLIGWAISLGEALVCAGVCFYLLRPGGFRWPLIGEDRLGDRAFGWGNLLGFIAVHVLVLLPVAAIYLAFCGSLAVNHFTDGFVSLRPEGMTMQVRKYTRDDGKTVELVPMSHVGEADFYQDIAASFPPTSVVLMEGVSDTGHLLQEKVGYKKTANDLGLAEQQQVFKPKGELVPADMDLGQFSKPTLDAVKRAMAFHAQGLNAASLLQLMQATPEDLPKQMFDDLLTRRNEHLLAVFNERLLTSDHIIIPWGAAHMPGISEGVLKAGFRLQDTEEYVAIRFGGKKGG